MRQLAVVVLFLVSAFLGGCETLNATLKDALQNAPKPSIKLVDGSLKDLSLKSVKLDLGVEVTNPYSVALPLMAADYSLTKRGGTDSEPFISGMLPNPETIPANGAKTFSVPIEIEFSKLLSVLQDIKAGSVIPYRADMTLKALVPGTSEPIELPVSKEGEFPIPTLPKVSLGSVKWDKLSLMEASGGLDIKIENANQFLATLQKLDYSLKLNGSPILKGLMDDPMKLAPGEPATLRIPISLKAAEVGMGLFTAMQKGEANFKIDGLMDVDTPFGKFGDKFAKEQLVKLIK